MSTESLRKGPSLPGAGGSRRWSRRGLGTGLVLAAAVVLAACGGSSDDAPATTAAPSGTVAPAQPATPAELTVGSPLSFEMPAETNDATFSFDVPAGAVVAVASTGDGGNSSSMFVTAGPAGQAVYRVELKPGEVADDYRYVTASDGGGPWTLTVEGRSGDTVTLAVDTPLQADGGTPGDAGADQADPKDVELGVAQTALLGDDDVEDWYRIPLAGGDVVALTASLPPGAGGSSLAGDIVYNGSPVASFTVGEGGEETVRQIFSQDQTGEAYLRLSGVGDYSFTIEAGPQQDGGTDGDAGGDLASAKEVAFGTIDGILGGEDAEDFYALTLPTDAVLTGELTAAADAAGELRIEFAYNGSQIARFSLGAGQVEPFTFAHVNSDGDTLFVRVAGMGGAYTLQLAAETQPDGGGGGDAASEAGLATEVEPAGSFDGILNNAGSIDPRDFYRFTAAATGILPISLAVDAEVGDDVRIQVKDESGAKVADFTVGRGGSGSAEMDVTEGVVYVMELVTPRQAAYTVTFP